jgi:hypothetical protein
VTLWKTAAEERMQRKWPSWSAHFAWGGALTLVGALKIDLGWAMVLSIIAGLLWEIGYAVMASPKIASNRASVVDWVFWVAGAVAGAMIFILWSL